MQAKDSLSTYAIAEHQVRDLVSRQDYVVTRLQLSVKRKESFVAKEDYDEISDQLKEEQFQHGQTKAKLAKETERLQFALGEIDILTQQLEKEKQAFQEAFGQLKTTAFQQKHHATALKEKYQEIEKVCDHQDDVILAKDSTIKDLKTRLVKQKHTHKDQLTDMAIQMEQERYLNQHFLQTDSKKCDINRNTKPTRTNRGRTK